MPGFNTIPGSSGGGGQPNMSFVGSIHMNTYNRSWAQAGTAGSYGLYSANQESGFAYFVGSVTTGVPLNRMVNLTHSFTRIDIVAPTNDLVSLYKVKTKGTTAFSNALTYYPYNTAAVPSASTYTSTQVFSMPAGALPLANLLICGAGGAGGHGSHSHGGGGGGGGGVVKLYEYPIYSGIQINIGTSPSGGNQQQGGTTFFGPVYALGGGGGGHSGAGHSGGNGANGGGGAVQTSGGAGITQTSGTGLGTFGLPAYHGGFAGGTGSSGTNNHHFRSGGGGGAGQAGQPGNSGQNSGGEGGAGHASDIRGTTNHYGTGGGGATYNNHAGSNSAQDYGHGARGGNENNANPSGGNGVVAVRYFTI
jgi:hypothetical protein